jgi:hypothetical protein
MNPNTPIQSTRCTGRLCSAPLRLGKTLVLAVARALARERSARWVLAALALAILASGCAESRLLREDPGFSAESLRKGGLAVLGVVQVDEVAQARPPLIAALERVLTGARKDIPLVRADQVRAALPDSAMRLFLLGYQMRGDPDSLWLARAASAVRPLARYGILARVEGTSVRYGTRNVPSSIATGEGGQDLRVTGRDVRVQASVYDLATGALVYRAKFFAGSDEAPNFRPVSADTLNPDSLPPLPPRGPSQTFRPGMTYPTPGPSDSPSDFGYPEAPSLARAAETAFLILARSLPGGPPPP